MRQRLAKIRPWAIVAIKILVTIVVLWGVHRVVLQAIADLKAQQWRPEQLHIGWLIAAGAAYAIGLLPVAWFWRRVLRGLGQRCAFGDVTRAYYLGHLGKYVPGKAMVIIMRVGMLRGASPAIGSVSVFIETLSLMAVGGLLAGGLLWWYDAPARIVGLALAVAFITGAPVFPPIAKQVLKRLPRTSEKATEALDNLHVSYMAPGWIALAIGWVGVGLSMWATAHAAGFTSHMPLAQQIALCTAAAAMAVAAGFLSFIPGGLIVREAVLLPLLAPVYGEAGALATAIIARIEWILVEALVSIILYSLRPRTPAKADGATSRSA